MPRGSQRDFNQTLMQMVISNHLQNKAQERQRQAAFQQSLANQALDHQREIAKEKRQLDREMEKKRYDFALDAVKEGNTELAARAFEGDLFGASEVTRATGEVETGAASGDPNLIVKGFQRAENLDPSGDTLRRINISGASAPIAEANKSRRDKRIAQEATTRGNLLDEGSGYVASTLAGIRTGLYGDDAQVPSRRMLRQELRQKLPGVSDADIETMISRGYAQAEDRFFSRKAQEMSAEGESLDRLAARASGRVRRLQRQGVSYQDALDRGLVPEGEQDALAYTSRDKLDPITNQRFFFDSKQVADAWEKDRRALQDNIIMAEELLTTFTAASELGNPSLMGPFVGAEGPQKLLQLAGQQDPYARAYWTTMFRMTTATAKGEQGARMSDKDIRFYLALSPSLTEIYSDSGLAAIQTMVNGLHLRAEAPGSPRIRAIVDRSRNKPLTKADRLYITAARNLQFMEQNGTDDQIRRAMQDFRDAQDRFLESGGRQRVLGDINQAGSVPQRGLESAVDRLNMKIFEEQQDAR